MRFLLSQRRGPIRRLLGAVILAAAACTGEGQPPAMEHADLVLTNARIYTVDENQPWGEAVAIRGGEILAVGGAKEIRPYAGAETNVIDVGGKLVLPAFADAHVHPVFGGMSYSRCPLHEGRSLEDYQEIIRACVAASPGDGAVYGAGWSDALFPPNGVPRKEVLDEVSTDRALIFESVGGHTFWVNSKALEVAGITKDTPDPVNGKIDRDPETGEPVGGLQETAMGLVAYMVPTPTPEELQKSILYVGEAFSRLGITSWLDAGVAVKPDGSSEVLDAYYAVHDSGELIGRGSIALTWTNGWSTEQIPTLLDTIAEANEAGLHVDSIKYYLDGVIPQQTAGMIEPYVGTKNRGDLQIDPEVLTDAVTRFGAEGVQPFIHAIGDRAVRVALDAFEEAIEANGSLERPMITHLNVIDPADQPRFGELGVIAQFQPTWSSNYPYMDLTKEAIGPERSKHIYPTGRVLRGGGRIAFGADWPVATADPLKGLQVAVTRVNYEDTSSPPLLSGDAISLEEAIKAHTLDAAYAIGVDETAGSVTAGKSADLIVLDKDIFELPAMQIDDADVILTLFEGRAVYGSLDQFGEE